jgi:hypothetical protein
MTVLIPVYPSADLYQKSSRQILPLVDAIVRHGTKGIERLVTDQTDHDTSSNGSLWSKRSLSRLEADHSVCNLESLFTLLDAWCQESDNPALHRVLRSTGLLTALHSVRSRYEFNKETKLAQRILANEAPGSSFVKLAEAESFWAASPNLIDALNGASTILVAGSGPLPLTAYCLAEKTGKTVTCVERDKEAFELGNALITETPLSGRISMIHDDVLELGCLDQFDAVFAAVLLGVGHDSGEGEQRGEMVASLLGRDLSITRGFPIAWIFGILASCRNLS